MIMTPPTRLQLHASCRNRIDSSTVVLELVQWPRDGLVCVVLFCVCQLWYYEAFDNQCQRYGLSPCTGDFNS